MKALNVNLGGFENNQKNLSKKSNLARKIIRMKEANQSF